MLTLDQLKFLSMAPFIMPAPFGVNLEQFIPVFLEHGHLQTYNKRDVLVPLDHTIQTVQILLSGLVMESSSNANGLEKGVLCFPTYPVALPAAIHQNPTVYSATAYTDVSTISIPYDQFVALLQGNRDILEHTLRFLAFDSRSANVTILQNCSCSTTEKVYQTIYHYHLACQHFAPLREVTLTQNLLASLSGVHRTSVAHVLKDLKEQEIIQTEKKTLTVLEPHILKDMAFANLL